MNIGIFASGGGSNFHAILKKIQNGELKDASVSLVISNNSKSGALETARNNSISALHISGKTRPEPADYESAIMDALDKYKVELIALAGYMKLLPAGVIKKYPGRILNIHPALLPKFGGKGMYGMHVHEAVLASGDSESGATIHYVNEKYDEGPIIRQSKVPVMPDDTPEDLAARVLSAEHDLYWRVIDDIVHGKIG